MASHVLAIDQGTTGSRAILYHASGRLAAESYQEFRQYFPFPGWVEHDASEIWESVASVIRQTVRLSKISPKDIAAIGITNQRETAIVWDKKTGKPLHRAIVWQDRRTSELTEKIKKSDLGKKIRNRTGLIADPYFSATKIKWMLDHRPEVRCVARRGQAAFGTVDSWLIWRLTGGRRHLTDLTNASRTMLLNIHRGQWDPSLLKSFKIPPSMLPQVLSSGADFGHTRGLGFLPDGIPIMAVMGDQQAALYGQGCYRPGESKNTYGTGCFVVVNTGKEKNRPPKGLIQTLACDRKGRSVYALEGSIFIGGSLVQWLRDQLRFFQRSAESEHAARSVPDSGGVTVIPALTGLGAPYWNPEVRGIITGITRATSREHLVRACLEAIGHQTADVLDALSAAHLPRIKALHVDGGATSNSLLMQIQANLLGIPVKVSDIAESTAWGVAKLAGLRAGVWKDPTALDRKRKYRIFKPCLSRTKRQAARAVWKREMSKLIL